MSQNGGTKKAKCSAKTRAGKPCKSPPVHGTEFCLAHSPAETRESVGFIPDNGKGGRKRIPTPTELARNLLEQHVEIIFRPHFKALGYDIQVNAETESMALIPLEGGGAKLFGESKEGFIEVSQHEDLGAMIAAAEKLLDRIYGRPRQALEVTGEGGGPIETRELIPSEQSWHDEVANVLAEAEAVTANGASAGSDTD